mgnify:CR=1 FL=1
MKTVIGALLALGFVSTAASAQSCPPGYGYGYGHGPRVGYHQPARTVVEAPVAVAPAAEAPVAAPIEPAPAPQQPAQEEAPPK